MAREAELLETFPQKTIREMIDRIKLKELGKKITKTPNKYIGLHFKNELNKEGEAKITRKRVLVCLDGSSFAEKILPYVFKEAVRFQNRLIFIQAIPRPVIDYPPIQDDPMEKESLVVEARKEYSNVKNYLERLASRVRKFGVEVETIVVGERAGASIVQYADNHKIDLIALVTHGRNGLKQLLFGSVANYILAESGLPVLLVRST